MMLPQTYALSGFHCGQSAITMTFAGLDMAVHDAPAFLYSAIPAAIPFRSILDLRFWHSLPLHVGCNVGASFNRLIKPLPRAEGEPSTLRRLVIALSVDAPCCDS